jgi:hypothetical protein
LERGHEITATLQLSSAEFLIAESKVDVMIVSSGQEALIHKEAVAISLVTQGLCDESSKNENGLWQQHSGSLM